MGGESRERSDSVRSAAGMLIEPTFPPSKGSRPLPISKVSITSEVELATSKINFVDNQLNELLALYQSKTNNPNATLPLVNDSEAYIRNARNVLYSENWKLGSLGKRTHYDPSDVANIQNICSETIKILENIKQSIIDEKLRIESMPATIESDSQDIQPRTARSLFRKIQDFVYQAFGYNTKEAEATQSVAPTTEESSYDEFPYSFCSEIEGDEADSIKNDLAEQFIIEKTLPDGNCAPSAIIACLPGRKDVPMDPNKFREQLAAYYAANYPPERIAKQIQTLEINGKPVLYGQPKYMELLQQK